MVNGCYLIFRGEKAAGEGCLATQFLNLIAYLMRKCIPRASRRVMAEVRLEKSLSQENELNDPEELGWDWELA